MKFADDTYLIIPADNIHTCAEEIENVETWARNNNLTLNKSKTSAVVFRDARRKQKATMPQQQLSGMARNTSLHILGVTMTANLSASDHIRGVLGKCSQTLYAQRVLRSHGLCDAGLQTVFQSVIVAKLLYASSAWSGFTTSDDRQRVNAFLRRGKRCGFCRQDLPMFEELLDNRDEQLFNQIMNNTQHVLVCYHHLQQHHNTANLGNECTTDSHLNTPGA